MKYNTAIVEDAQQARKYFNDLLNKQVVVEVKHVRKGRSLKQNAYLHLLLADFGMHFGYTVEESKQIFKKCSADIFSYERNNTTFWLSTADVDSKQMTDAIDRFKDYSANAGHQLPDATDEDWLRSIENRIEQDGRWL